MLTATSPLTARAAGYLRERFPPGPYTVLVVLFFGSGVLCAAALAGVPLPPRAAAGGLVVWLVFFHLRVFDEHKDHALDQRAYPDRLLSRGVVTLPLLATMAGVAIVAEAVISALIGPQALLWWGLTFAFTVLMRLEFGVGRWLRARIFLYAVTHNPVVGLLAMYALACTGVPFTPAYLWYVAAASLGSLAFEIGRKLRQPGEEIPGVDSYSSVHGRARAGAVLAAVILAAAGCSAATMIALQPPSAQRSVSGLLLASGTIVGIVGSLPSQAAKRAELGASLYLLVSLLAMGVAAW